MTANCDDASSGDEAERLRAVERYRIFDTLYDRVFACMAYLAASIFDAPMAAVSLVDAERNWFQGVHGLDVVSDVPRNEGLCGPVIAEEIPSVACDVLDDGRAKDNRFVRKHDVRFYACAPIVDPHGHALGTVAVMDTSAKTPTDEQLRQLANVAAVVMEQLEVRLASHQAVRLEQRLRGAAEAGRDDALRDRDSAIDARDEARRERDDARTHRQAAERGRDDARVDRDSALRDRDVVERDRDVIAQYATVLQRTLLPPTLPAIPGMEVAAHYHPASPRLIGGDFYDVFPLSADRWAFFIGDVQGHGVEAAVATSLIRYTLRTAVLHHDTLVDAIAELNDVLLRELDPRRFCTVLLGTIERAGDTGFQLTIATGGHEPALLIDPERSTASAIRSTGGMLVGAVPSASFQSCGVLLEPNHTLLLYTDGIVEARLSEPVFDGDALASFAAERAELGAVGLVRELATLIPTLEPQDDVAVLAFTAL